MDSVRRIRSSRFLVDGALFGLTEPLVAASDGYWLEVVLQPGVHQVSTVAEAASFSASTSYTITAQ